MVFSLILLPDSETPSRSTLRISHHHAASGSMQTTTRRAAWAPGTSLRGVLPRASPRSHQLSAICFQRASACFQFSAGRCLPGANASAVDNKSVKHARLVQLLRSRMIPADRLELASHILSLVHLTTYVSVSPSHGSCVSAT